MTIVPAQGHREVILKGTAATCTTEGVTDGKMCSQCQAVLQAQAGIPQLQHTVAKTDVTAATAKTDGQVIKTCACGKVISKETVYSIASVKMSFTKRAYTGWQCSPTITVTDSEGNLLKQNVDYIVKKPAGRKNVGKYTFVVTFQGNYAGTKNLTLTITPKATKVSKTVAAKKAVTVKWQKVKKQNTGYQVMVATNKKFTTGKKSVYVKNYNKNSVKISKLKAKKTYYVKVRTYKTVKINGKSTKIYSGWSTVKTVKTK